MQSGWKRHVFALNALLFAVLGLFCLAISWDGLRAWWHFTSLPYEEVRDSTMEPIWTSRWVVPAMLFLVGGLLNAGYWLQLVKRRE